MADYVKNILEITGDECEIKRIIAVVKGKGKQFFDFEKIIPMPKNIYRGPIGKQEEKLYGRNNWYDWSLANWGTKWNALLDSYSAPENSSNRSDGFVKFEFDTAWNPPIPVIETLAERFPTLSFIYKWAHENILFGYCGERTYSEGVKTSDWEPESKQDAVEYSCYIWGIDPCENFKEEL